MIRINLLAVERQRAKKRKSTLAPAQLVNVGAVAILLVTALGILWWFWTLRQASAQLDADIARAEAEAQKLKAVLAQVQQFEERKGQLQQRVTLIEELRRGQTGPVHALDEISRAVPDRLWLTEMTQKGADFTLAGTASSLTAVSEFVENLASTHWFKKPIEIVDSQVQQDARAGDLVNFTVRATFHNPEAPAPPAAAAAGRRSARGRR